MTALQPIPSRYLRDHAFLRLREAIVTGALAPGSPLVIADVAASFELSSMPVREAVKRLVSDGLVEEEQPRRAHRVAPLTRESALHVLEVVGALMIRAYELGVPNLTKADIRRIRAALDAAAKSAADDDLPGVLAHVHHLHGIVYTATGNPEFARTISAIVPRFDRVLFLWYTESLSAVERSYRSDLVVALEGERRDDAVDVMRSAWDRFRDAISARDH